MFFHHSASAWIRFRRQVATALLALATTGVATASESWMCLDTEACGECGDSGCADSLTGPLYQPSEPPVQDQMAPFVQSTTPDASFFAGGLEGTLTAQGHAPGYIDWALPRTQLRLRYDTGWDSNKPDRAEFIYAQYDNPGPGDLGTGRGNTRVDFRDIRAYMEIASDDSRYSIFAELPVRFLDTSASAGSGLIETGDTGGLGDVEAGIKISLSRDPSHWLTFQLKTYIPTGEAGRGLGTDHVSIEPGLLFMSEVSSNLTIFGEVRDWIPVDGSQFNGEDYFGNVLRYGLGAAFTAIDTCNYSVSPITEFVGWSVLDGQVFNPDFNFADRQDAATTIVNGKFGVRTLFKRSGNTFYVGYGRCLTGERWYQDFLRVEYTIFM